MFAIFGALVLQVTTPAQPDAAALASGVTPFFEAVAHRAQILGSCSTFNEPNALKALGDELLALPEVAVAGQAFDAPMRSLLEGAFQDGAERPVEQGLTANRCAALTEAAVLKMQETLPGFRAAYASAEAGAEPTH